MSLVVVGEGGVGRWRAVAPEPRRRRAPGVAAARGQPEAPLGSETTEMSRTETASVLPTTLPSISADLQSEMKVNSLQFWTKSIQNTGDRHFCNSES